MKDDVNDIEAGHAVIQVSSPKVHQNPREKRSWVSVMCCRGPKEARRLGMWVRAWEIDSFFTEKAWILVEAWQVYAIMWVLGVQWPLPLTWQRLTSFTLVFNLDFVYLGCFSSDPATFRARELIKASQIRTNSISPEVLFAAFSAICATLGPLIVHQIYSWRKRKHVVPWQGTEAKARLERRILAFYRAVYLPILLALTRLLFPSSDFETGLPASLWTTQWGPVHLVALVFAGLSAIVLLLLLPAWLRLKIRDTTIAHSNKEHEAFIKRKELEYVVDISPDWLLGHMSVVSSFHYNARYHILLVFWRKAFTVAIAAGLKYYPSANGIGLMALQIIIALYVSLRQPYRCKSTNSFAVAVECIMVYNTFLGSLKASQIRSAFAVDSTVVTWFTVGNMLIALALFLALTDVTIRHHRGEKGFRWPVTLKDGDDAVDDPRVSEWVTSVRTAYRLLNKIAQVPLVCAPSTQLRRRVKQVSENWTQAKENEHLLSDTLVDVLDDLQVWHQDRANGEAVENTELELLLPSLVKAVKRRERETVLMRPSKRAIMFKLFVLKTWIGDRKIAKLKLTALGNSAENLVSGAVTGEREMLSNDQVGTNSSNDLQHTTSLATTAPSASGSNINNTSAVNTLLISDTSDTFEKHTAKTGDETAHMEKVEARAKQLIKQSRDMLNEEEGEARGAERDVGVLEAMRAELRDVQATLGFNQHGNEKLLEELKTQGVQIRNRVVTLALE